MRAAVFANGLLDDYETARKIAAEADLVVAADGGYLHCRAIGIRPRVVVGDMDSLHDDMIDELATAGIEILRHPARKDKTDLELALALAVEQGAREITVLGGLGARWDMTLANVMILAAPSLEQVDVRLREGPYEILTVKGGNAVTVRGAPGDTVSLLPLGGTAEGVTLCGLEYPLTDHTIGLGSTLGISNVLVEGEATIALKQGRLLCVVTHKEIMNLE